MAVVARNNTFLENHGTEEDYRPLKIGVKQNTILIKYQNLKDYGVYLHKI